jgi:capsule polysaccharide export protein KpsE/RkpR
MAQSIDLSFLRNRNVQRRLVAVAAIFALAGVVYALLAPKWYRSVMTVVPTKAPKTGGLASLLGGDLAGMAGGFDASTTGGSDAARIAAVLQSTAVIDAVIEKFDLRTRYGETLQEGAREAVLEYCSVRTMPKPNLVQVSCEDKDPRFAQALVGFLGGIGTETFNRVNVSSASEEVRLLERRVGDLRKQADEASARMREFQEKHQIVDLDSQARAVVSSVAALHEQRIGRQMELDYARKFSSPDEAQSRQLMAQLSVVEDQLRDLEEAREPASGVPAPGKGRRGGAPGMFPAALAVPKLRAEYEKLYRDRKVAEASLIFALDRLEGAKASEARDVSTFVVLDPPTLPTRKSRPGRLYIVLSWAAVGVAAGFSWELWRFRRRAS